MKYALILAALLLAGCSNREVDPEVPNSNSVPSIKHSVGYNTVHEIKLTDGTQCAVLSGYYAGGLDCNWRTTNE